MLVSKFIKMYLVVEILTKIMAATGPTNDQMSPLSNDSQHLMKFNFITKMWFQCPLSLLLTSCSSDTLEDRLIDVDQIQGDVKNGRESKLSNKIRLRCFWKQTMDLIKVGEMMTRHQRVSFLFLWVVSCYEKRLYFSSFFVLNISICVNSNMLVSVIG